MIRLWFGVVGLCLLGTAVQAADPPAILPPAATREVDFVRDIQPIFADRCNACHGEDEQQGQLRLDAKAIVLRGGKSGPLFASGTSGDSLLVKRLVGTSGGKRMPLDDDPLSAAQIGLIRAWIDQGAKWPDGIGSAATNVKKHWAYVVPERPLPPSVTNSAWPESAVDSFILARLEAEGIGTSPLAEQATLIRRASLDLTGIPPGVVEVDRFLADESPDAYEQLIDRLLASPRYGERWATPWLDAARYADSNGYQRDGHRVIWPYRDWVIRALNTDMSFDQFTVEQIAGDLLPGATIDQQIATGFHRCTTVNVEAGTDEEENRVNQVIDRVNVTGTVWLGTTLECCQCHDHKFDPFTQRDYYQFFAFFNNTPKETYQRTKGSAALDFGGPEAKLPADPKQERRRREITAETKRLEAEIEQCLEDESTGLSAWLADMADADRAEKAKLPANVRRILAVAAEKRNKNQQNVLRNYFVSLHPTAKKTHAEMEELQKQLEALAPASSLVMNELSDARSTMIFKRGDFLSPGDAVEAAAPAILPAMSAELPQNRLGLARWLVDPANPLTPRVQVNRAWAQFFGRGIVASEEDFGLQSEPATHPELLDWLAAEFRADWSLKATHRRIVESATYRQSSKYRSDLANRDPNNLLIAKAPRIRLSAETIRDNALAIGGHLSSKLHGPPVYPPQPDGIWRVTGLVDNTYRTSEGDDAWRRGVYTVWRRSAPYPSFINFDAPDRSACTVKRPRSNTPLQALILQNDPVYVELAWSFAERMLSEAPQNSLDEQLRHAFRTALTRSPTPAELAALRASHDKAHSRYHAAEKARMQLMGKRAVNVNDDSQLAAWFNVAQVLLNLDETITKN